MRFVPIKTDGQLDMQALHRVRDRLVAERTALTNQARGLLLERGVVVAKGRRALREALSALLADGGGGGLGPRMRALLSGMRAEWEALETGSRPSTRSSPASPATTRTRDGSPASPASA